MQHRREIDKYCGARVCDLTDEDRVAYESALAKRGAYEALAMLGLTGPEALQDISDLKSLLRSFRVVKKAFWSQVGRTVGLVVTAAMLGYIIGAQRAKAIFMLLTPGG